MASPSRPSRQFQDIDDDDDLINTPPTQNPKPFVADSAAYAQLLDLGFNPNAIFRGLYYTGNKSVELAAAWVIEHENDPRINLPIADELSFQQPDPVIDADADDESDPLMAAVPTDPSGFPSSASTTSPSRHGAKTKARGTGTAQQPASVEELDDSDDDILAVSAGEDPRGLRRADDPKMVFVVNHSLKMGVGKIASQVAHAAVLLFQQLQERERDIETLFRWHEIGMKKIVLKSLPRRAKETQQPPPPPILSGSASASATGAASAGSSASADASVVEKPPVEKDGSAVLRELQVAARRANLPTALVADAGRTQIDPGSITVLGLFGPSSRVDQLTGHLALL